MVIIPYLARFKFKGLQLQKKEPKNQPDLHFIKL